MTEQTNGLRFDIYERVHLPDEVAAIEELEEIELVPHMQALPADDQVNLRGHLLLTGFYRTAEDAAAVRQLEHWIPVEISLPLERVRRMEELTVEIDNFDVDLLSTRTLNVTGVLALKGLQLSTPQAPVWREDGDGFTVVHQAAPERSESRQPDAGSDPSGAEAPEPVADSGAVTADLRIELPDPTAGGAEERPDADDDRAAAYARAYATGRPAATGGLEPAIGPAASESPAYGSTPFGSAPFGSASFGSQAFGSAESDYSAYESAKSGSSAFGPAAVEPSESDAADIRPARHEEPGRAYASAADGEPVGPLSSAEDAGPAEPAWAPTGQLYAEQPPFPPAEPRPEAAPELKVALHAMPADSSASPPDAPPAAVASSAPSGVGLLSQLGDKAARVTESRAGAEEPEQPPADGLGKDATGDELEWTRLFLSKGEQTTFRKVRMCIVQKDETLDAIAERYNVQSRELQLANGLRDPYVSEGQVLHIP